MVAEVLEQYFPALVVAAAEVIVKVVQVVQEPVQRLVVTVVQLAVTVVRAVVQVVVVRVVPQHVRVVVKQVVLLLVPEVVQRVVVAHVKGDVRVVPLPVPALAKMGVIPRVQVDVKKVVQVARALALAHVADVLIRAPEVVELDALLVLDVRVVHLVAVPVRVPAKMDVPDVPEIARDLVITLVRQKADLNTSLI